MSNPISIPITASSLLSWVKESSDSSVSSFFDHKAEHFIARAPGRLDLMGGIADYSGSLVLQWPIREATWAIVQGQESYEIAIATMRLDSDRPAKFAAVPFEQLIDSDGQPRSYIDARSLLTADRETRWGAYVAGVILVLMRERGVTLNYGARILIASDVPDGKGVSSSAALEVSTMMAVSALLGIELGRREIGLLCQKVENEVVGAPCGVMDQMASSCADEGALMALRCRPAELLPSVPLPDGMSIWGIDSGVRHSVSGADYGTVRTGAFMGLTIIEQTRRDLGGYLTTLSPAETMSKYAEKLPDQMTGVDFTAQYGKVDDMQSVVIPDRMYPIKAATLHPINENFRVNLFRELLGLPVSSKSLYLLGELMYEAHESYSWCGLGTAQTEQLVELVRQAGPDRGLYGAKITGGGSGGTVAILGASGSDEVIREIAKRYEAETGLASHIFTGTSPGAYAYGVTRI